MRRFAQLVCLACLAVSTATAADPQPAPPRYEDRWVYAMHDLTNDKQFEALKDIIRRAGESKYNGLVLADYNLHSLQCADQSYFKRLSEIRAATEKECIQLIPAVFPMGYANGFLAVDPNLAEGVPARDVPFVVDDKGKVSLVPRPGHALVNGGLEELEPNGKLKGMSLHDGRGQDCRPAFSSLDSEVHIEGTKSLRFDDAPENARIGQSIQVRPWSCLRLTACYKTKGFKLRDAENGALKLLVLDPHDRNLTFHQFKFNANDDWTKIDVVFNTLANTKLHVYLGAWGGCNGSIWFDDLKLEELSLVNVIRRDACPLTVASADGATIYVEGKDFQRVEDPKLGRTDHPGEFSFRHTGPSIALTPTSTIKKGDSLKVTWYHPIVFFNGHVMCSLSDPSTYGLIEEQARHVYDALKPRTWFMLHDEIRMTGWCEDARKSCKTPGQRLAENVRRCTDAVRKLDPAARVVVWSDMFDPNHNASTTFNMVNGSFAGSWEGLDKDVDVVNWHEDDPAASLKFFADRGHRQIIAGYYDRDHELGFRLKHEAGKNVSGVRGFMYTPWKTDTGFCNLESYGRLIQEVPNQPESKKCEDPATQVPSSP